MKVEKYINKGKDKYQVLFDNDEVLDTYEEVIIKYHLFGNKEIDKETYKNIVKDTSLQERINDCLKYIKVRLRSVKEIRDYYKDCNLKSLNKMLIAIESNQLENYIDRSSLIDDDIDYNRVDLLLQKEKEKSESFIRKALSDVD